MTSFRFEIEMWIIHSVLCLQLNYSSFFISKYTEMQEKRENQSLCWRRNRKAKLILGLSSGIMHILYSHTHYHTVCQYKHRKPNKMTWQINGKKFNFSHTRAAYCVKKNEKKKKRNWTNICSFLSIFSLFHSVQHEICCLF